MGSGPGEAMIREMDDRSFADLLGTIWERHGWETEVTARDDDYLVAGDRPDGRRGLILVSPGADPVGPGPVQELATMTEQKGIDVPVAATRSSFESAAREIAESASLHLLDPETLEQTAAAEGFEDLLQQYSSEGGSGLADRLPDIDLGGIPSPGVGRLRGMLAGGNGMLLGVVGVVILILAGSFLGLGDLVGGLLAGLPIPDLGVFDAIGGLLSGLPGLGLGGEGFSVTAVSLVDAEGDPVTVSWEATRGNEIVGPNGTSYEAPENHTFVLVAINASNPTAEAAVIEERDLGFAAGDSRYGPQPLAGAEGQVPLIVPPATSAEGFVVFTVPESATEGTLLGLPGPEATPLHFERVSGLQAPVTVA